MRVRRALSLLAAALTALAVGAAPAPVAATPQPAAGTYTNPVTAGVVDTFPDPAMIRGADGNWYAYGTTNPIFNSRGETGEHILPVLRSPDMVHWTYAGDVYTEATRPSWWPAGTRPFAPDIHYVAGSYHLTYGLSGGGVVLLTGPTPTGPWTDHGLIATLGTGCPTNPAGTIDQSMITDTTGTHYLYWGSYDTVCVSAMNTDATRLTGPITQVLHGRRAEGSFPVRRGDHYYLFYSDAGCCQGSFSGYTVKVGRADNPRGPFYTQDGQALTDLSSKNGIVLAANGNGFAGPGHNAIQTDLSGQDWLVYHAIPSSDPDFPPVSTDDGVKPSLSKRPMMIDRLDWIDGWPVVRAGAGPSAGPQPAPVTTPVVGSTFNGPTTGWSARGGAWKVEQEPGSGGVLTQSSSDTSYYLSPQQIGGDIRAQGRLKLTGGAGGAVGLTVSDRNARNTITAWVDREHHTLAATVTNAGVATTNSVALPSTFEFGAWHEVAVEARGGTLTAEVSDDGLRDAQATVTVNLSGPKLQPGRIGVASTAAPAAADNLSAVPLYQPVTSRVAEPAPGVLLPGYSDDFTGTGRPEAVDPAWTWVRGGAATATEGGGTLTWPTQAAELYLGDNTAPVLLRDAPPGDFLVETKLAFDGTKAAQQAGILLYGNDDRYFKLVHSVLPMTAGNGAVFQQTEFDKEGDRPTTIPPTPVFNGPMFGGPPGATTWLRLAYHHNPGTGADDVREASSTDGVHWSWGGTWSLPHQGPLKIGVVSMNTPGATAVFDYVHTFTTAG
ncbi:family 43 glycosylhydrolase [Amycolatopsis sp. K13G38]|uniref:Family 43 glycosylhydrolase n=1 Tax=Amycolatopsis acididurans TaxID=2724524 RepID=A0ABX1J0G4_9PSEU|nr:family 43 glycosylhydrolase [Amycolatopsis acididurans]NKQ51860.1 family 43 glycosylhydrolase [Amycolatopsis acididurans]